MQSYTLQVGVSFVPLQDPSPSAPAAVRANRTDEGSKLISSIAKVSTEHTIGKPGELDEVCLPLEFE